jgi:hypothetical protein
VDDSVKSRIKIKNLKSKAFEVWLSFLGEGQNAFFGGLRCQHWVKS